MTLNVAQDMVVSLAYSLRDGDGNLLDAADASDPLVYLHGHENLLPKFEAELVGKQPGDKHSFVLSPEDAYGEALDDPRQKIHRSHLPEDGDPEVGMELIADFGQGFRPYAIVAVDEEEVTIDLNHPLAGKTLKFDIEVLEIRAAEEEEVAHGHVHGPGGHHH